MAIIAISGSRVSSYDDDGDDHFFDEYWYEDLVDKSYDADIKEPAKSTPSASGEESKTSPATIAEENKVFNRNDFLLEDVRSELENSDEDFRADDIKDASDYSSGKFDSNDTLVPLTGEIEKDKIKLEDTAESTAFKNENYDDIPYYSNESEKKILEETKTILDEDKGNDFEKFKSDDNIKKMDNEMIDDTSKILFDTSDLLGESDEKENKGIEKVDESVSLEDTIKEVPETAEEDTVSKAVGDLMTDIDNLDKTWDKLIGLDDNNRESPEVGEDGLYDYEEIDDDNLDKIFDTILKKQVTENVSAEKVIENVNKMTTKEPFQVIEEVNNSSEPILYLNDALMASETENINSVTTQKDDVSDTVLVASANTAADTEQASTTEAQTMGEADSSKSSELSSAEAEQLMKDFAAEHKELMQISSADVRNAINIRLTVDKPVVITSPDFPRPYPTDNTVDWMITGDGMGIELNITDFHVNGFRGDYVLIKPGGVDPSGSTGLLVTYELKTERRYRFIDVDQMFIRFHSATGTSLMRGFSMSMRMVVPRPGAIIEDVTPEPEPVIPTPPATITLNLGGVSLERFIQIEEEFRKIIADMATIYINTHGIDPGLNNTLETTQILSRALCFHNWPKFELCTEVKFGVPIVYEEDEDVVETRPARLNETDLMDMWETMSQRDPFAVRLRMLGITEYQVPNDHGVLTIWFVIAGGVVISMAMLAFALWRFSCFAGYARMPSFSDTDSIKEKQNLDLYPTPHQTLPPLYSEYDYKWADAPFDSSAKADMGGYSNRSYMHNDFFEIESEEEVMPTRDRSSGFSPRDMYSV